jgi:signal transduction histidine kinase
VLRDSGVGIDPQNLRKIFDTFYTTKPEAMGMGLTVSRSIVERHHGSLAAMSSPGEGATFQLILPVLERDQMGPTRPLVRDARGSSTGA